MNTGQLQAKLDRGLIDSKVLLSRAKFLDAAFRDSPAFADKRYLPFYYHLGGVLTPRRVIQVGSRHGLIGACFLQNCPTVEEWVVEEPSIPDPPVAVIRSNLSLFGRCNVALPGAATPAPPFDLGLLTDRYAPEEAWLHLDRLWGQIAPEGLIVADYIHGSASGDCFHEFCRVKNREPVVFGTRYGVGILTR